MTGLEQRSTAAVATGEADAGIGLSSAPSGRRHDRLKAATRAAHTELDGFTMDAGFFDSASRFAAYLAGMARFHRAYAAVTRPNDVLGWCAMWHLDHHAGWIAEDLHALGERSAPLTPAAGTGGTATDPAAGALATLEPKSTGRLLGSLYVLAGSTLGARMLHRLTVTRAFPTVRGSWYLANAGASINWQQFLAFLEGAEIDSEDRMIEGALATFTGVQRSLELGA